MMRHVSEPAQESSALEAHGLTNRFGHQVAADHVELRVPRGCAFGYREPNGAGKAATVRKNLDEKAPDRTAETCHNKTIPVSNGLIRPLNPAASRSTAGRRSATSPRAHNTHTRAPGCTPVPV
jgi:hypothetical protein